MSATKTVPVLPFHSFPQTQTLHPARVFECFFAGRIAAEPVTSCNVLNGEGCECGEPAILQVLPDGDDALCAAHFRKAVRRG
jgi:hypothetical protein